MAGKKLCNALFIYWLILVVWQNNGDYVGSGNLALAIKLVLVLFLTVKFSQRSLAVRSPKLVIWLLFAIYMVVSLVVHGGGESSAIIFYLFPVIFTLLTFIFQENAEVDENSYFNFLRAVIVVVSYMAIYSLLFKTSYFANLFHLTSTYGNELSSFLVSSHEYGMYLVFGIISCVLCFAKASSTKMRVLYIIVILVFSLNLLATLSRTSILALVVFGLTFFLLSGKNRAKKYIVAAIIVFLAACILIPEVRSFTLTVVFKESNDAGRVIMWNGSIEHFKNASIVDQLFGMGNSETAEYVATTFGHGAVHNAFIQVLLVLGVSGEIWLVGCIISSLINGIRIRKIDKNYGALFIALTVSAISFLFTNTACIMESPIDSFMLTIFTITIPYYVSNSIYHNGMESKYSETHIHW